MPSEVTQQILAFHDRLAGDPHHRYRSWEHCFQHFQKRSLFTSSQAVESATLHLAFYLASWGMYRGSSFLLQRDYSIHLDAVSTLLRPEYGPLWCATFDDPADDDETARLAYSLSEALKATYRQHIADERTKLRNPTDTLITKILLGTIGCTPACDRLFILGFKYHKLRMGKFSPRFLQQVFRFYRENADSIEEARITIKQRSGIGYPAMKLIDMYFWQVGSQLSPETNDNGDGA
jgi:hypothetical protein